MDSNVTFTPAQLLDYCMSRLKHVPYTIENENEVGKPIKEVTALLQKLHDLLEQKESTDVGATERDSI